LTKEEHAVDSLKKICLAILSSDKNVRFVGVVDSKGKLLVGEYNIYRFFEKSGNNINASLVKSSTFYSSYVVPAIKIRRKVKANQSQVVHFKLVELGDEVYLAVIPLLMEKRHDDNNNNIIINNNSNRYLCIYIELENISSEAAVSSSLTTTSYKEIISKIINDSI
jgi:hypothetical protein